MEQISGFGHLADIGVSANDRFAPEAQLGAILKLVPVSQLVMGLDFPLMPKSTFAPAIAEIGRYPTFNKADLQRLSYGNAGRLYPALKARIEKSIEHNGSGSPTAAESIRGST